MSFLTHAREGRMVWIWEGHWKVAAGSTVVLVAWARGQGSLTPLLTQLRSIAKPPCYIRNPSVYTSIDPTAVSAIDWQERPHWSSIHSFFFFFFWPHRTAWGILVPQPRMDPVPPAVETWVLTTGAPGKFLPIHSYFLQWVLQLQPGWTWLNAKWMNSLRKTPKTCPIRACRLTSRPFPSRTPSSSPASSLDPPPCSASSSTKGFSSFSSPSYLQTMLFPLPGMLFLPSSPNYLIL